MNEETTKRLIITGASVVVGFTLKQLAESGWRKVYKENPPNTHPDKEINWKKVILWSVVTGTAISSAKLATKRYLTLKLKE